jgi:hypothetical protein
MGIHYYHSSNNFTTEGYITWSKQLLFKVLLVLLVWVITIILECLTLLFGAFVPNHAKVLNALGLFLLVFFPIGGIIGTILLLR